LKPLSSNLAFSKSTTRRLGAIPIKWNTKTKLYDLFRTPEEFSEELDKELELDRDNAAHSREAKNMDERQRAIEGRAKARAEIFKDETGKFDNEDSDDDLVEDEVRPEDFTNYHEENEQANEEEDEGVTEKPERRKY
jgi:hypothetical protein